MKNNLAIIIPAYKSYFLERTLESLSNQTNKKFNVYIGNDNSPDNLEEIINLFRGKLNIIYKRFDDNLGANSLVKPWERCIELSTEDWIWLFSDDDIASPTCVENFFNEIKQNSEAIFFKFSTKIIDSQGKVLPERNIVKNQFKKEIYPLDFLNSRLNSSGFRSFAVEYIFSRELFNSYKFKSFPIAWASDDATWFMYALCANKIIGINDIVYWRLSGQNISSISKSKDIVFKKMDATQQFVKWLILFCESNKIDLNFILLFHWLTIQISSVNYKVNYKLFNEILKQTDLFDKVGLVLKVKKFIIIKYYHIRNGF